MTINDTPKVNVVTSTRADAGSRRRAGHVFPGYPPRSDVVKTMLKLAQGGPGDVVYDLGSGDSRIVIAAVRDHGGTGVRVEVDEALVRSARAGVRKAGVADKVPFA